MMILRDDVAFFLRSNNSKPYERVGDVDFMPTSYYESRHPTLWKKQVLEQFVARVIIRKLKTSKDANTITNDAGQTEPGIAKAPHPVQHAQGGQDVYGEPPAF